MDKNFYIFKNINDTEFIYSGFSGLVLEYNSFIKESVNNSKEVDSDIYKYLFEDPFMKAEFSFFKDDAEVDTIQVMIRDTIICHVLAVRIIQLIQVRLGR